MTENCRGNRMQLSLVLLFIFMIIVHTPLSADSLPKKKILILFSYEYNMPWQRKISEGILEALKSQNQYRISLLAEYTSLGVFDRRSYEQKLVEVIKTKYADLKIDLIIAAGVPASRFFEKYHKRIMPGVPAVLLDDVRNYSADYSDRAVLSISDKFEIHDTVRTAFSLFPETEHIVLVSGGSAIGQNYLRKAEREVKGFSGRADITCLAGLPIAELMQRIEKLPPHSIVLYMIVLQDENKYPVIPREVLKKISERTNAPVFGIFDSLMGAGLLGGKMSETSLRGKLAIGEGLKIISEKTGPGAKFIQAESHYYFDALQLDRWKVNEKMLPKGSIVRFRERSALYEFRGHITVVFILVALQSLLIVYLLFNKKRRKEAEQELIKAHEELENRVEERTRELKEALNEVQVLGGLLPICSSCGKIRDDDGYWSRLEQYLEKHSDVQFTHSLCGECATRIYGKNKWFDKMQRKEHGKKKL